MGVEPFRTSRRTIMAMIVAGIAPLLVPRSRCRAQGLNPKSADLQDRLEKGLQARRPSEFAFLKRVVELVNAGKLSTELVQSTFDWARHKRPWPYPFFERALKIRAARIGVVID